MRRLLQRIFDLSRYDSLIEKDRAQLVYIVSSVLFLLAALFMVLAITMPENVFGDSVVEASVFGPLFAVFFAGIFVAIIATRRGNSNLGGLIVVLLGAASFGGLSVSSGSYTMQDGMLMLVILSLSGLLLGQRGLVLGLVLVLGLTFAAMTVRTTTPYTPSDSTYEFIVVALLTAMATALIYAFLRYANINREAGAASAEAERMKLAQLTSLITTRISRRLALSEVLRNTVEEIRQIYPDIYHAQIFLTEPSGVARLVASTGEVGKMLIDRQHSLPIGSQSVIGQVTMNNQFVIARSNSTNTVHRRNEFLPDTKVEAAFPMRIGDAIIGALDLQSKHENIFNEEDVPIFQSLADNVAIAIDNARLFEETERRLVENQQLVAQMRQSSEEVEQLNERLTGRFWKDFLNQKDAPALDLDLATQAISLDRSWTPTIKEAIESNQSLQSRANDTKVVTVPLRVRGQVIGAMEFEMDEKGNLSPEDLAMMEEVSEQLGLAAESNRLYETSQRIAQREALVNEISTRLQSGTSVEMTLASAARSLKDVLKANRVAIRLGKPPVEAANGGNS
jgi:GAF domain-containing protein